MDLKALVKDVSTAQLAAATGIPRRTLFRWVENGGIPGREPEKKMWAEKLEKAAAKLRKRSAA